jgi:diaminohydroxyphosphoribosylaminopyrimidine deaminase / 5-amino-6-(5-phosphoribosylamino)uracil reductase
MSQDELYMYRCIELARLASGHVAPNPMVGAVLVHQGRIIGEGYHEKFGGPHAEVNCLESITDNDRDLISSSTLYVSLEPCAHFGKTPPCADLIIKNKIPKVIIGCRDPFKAVDGKGIEKLKNAGIEVLFGILENECRNLNAAFFCYHTKHRPYVILKWAETADSKIAAGPGKRLLISHEFTNRIVHRWRSEVMCILVGRKTAAADNPALNTRLWPGNNPVRLVVDPDLSLQKDLKLFDKSVPTIVFNYHKNTMENLVQDWKENGVHYYQLTRDVSLPLQVVNALYHFGIQSVLVEGGAKLLQSFIDKNLWDEARVITNQKLLIGEGLAAPVLAKNILHNEFMIQSDRVRFYTH